MNTKLFSVTLVNRQGLVTGEAVLRAADKKEAMTKAEGYAPMRAAYDARELSAVEVAHINKLRIEAGMPLL